MDHNTDHNLLERLVEFYRNYYRNEIGALAQSYPSDRQSLCVEFNDLYSFDPKIADDLRNNPDAMLEHLSEALPMVDLPVDIDLSGASVRPTKLPDQHIYGVGDLRSEQTDTYLGVYGNIARVTDCSPKVTIAAYACQRCNTITRIPQSGEDLQEPHECQSCGRQGPFRMDVNESEFVDQRRILLKQPPEDAENGDGDKITIYLEGDAADPPNMNLQSRVGEDTVIYGRLDLEQRGNSRNKSPVFDQYLEGYDFEFERDTDDIDISEHKEEFMAAADSPNAYEKFIQSMASDIYPYGRWPLALRLGAAYLMGGVRVSPEQGSTYRGDIHMAVIGPPGVGKSKFSHNLAELSPGSERRSATGLSSDVGLTAAAVQDDFVDDGWVLKPGILPRAKDHAILDEADKTNAQLSKINDALEGEQLATIDKGGIHAKLKTRVGLLAMANPEGGRWDENMGVKEQVAIDESLWSRFDGIVFLEDNPDEDQDEALAEHILENYQVNLEREKTDVDTEDTHQAPVSWDAMKAWVKYARENIRPELSNEAESMLREYYVDIRNDDSFAENSFPTARKLEAGIRFSSAYAKIRLSETVEACDVKMAVDLSKSLLGQSLNGGELDADVFTEAEEKSQKERKDRIRQAIMDEHKTPNEIADEIGADVERVKQDLDKWYRRTNPAVVTKNDGAYKWVA